MINCTHFGLFCKMCFKNKISKTHLMYDISLCVASVNNL